jgi:hypothetical protein
MIRQSTLLHFKKHVPTRFLPQSVDIACLRSWLQNATIGGRVNAYAKTYTSRYAGQIIEAFLREDIYSLQNLYRCMREEDQCMQVLDFTSLYPYAMDSCPMPTRNIRFVCAEECEQHIQAIHCDVCDSLMTFCPKHRCSYDREVLGACEKRPFTIILVRCMYFDENIRRVSKRNMCARKTFLSSKESKPVGLVYSLEDQVDMYYRKKEKESVHLVQSFTNIDLYWMRRQGFHFTIVGGFGFETGLEYNLFIGPAFKDRIQAKKDGNKLLSDFLKLNYNGAFGITTQQDITDSYFVARVPEELRDVDPRHIDVRRAVANYIRMGKKDSKQDGTCATEELTRDFYRLPNGQSIFQKKKKEHLSEFFASQSPMQIGAAILSWSRHIANLVMFNIHEEDQIYTDTDSICINDGLIRSSPSLQKLICNRDDAPIGSLKNDHAEGNGTEPRIFFGMIGGKKVKGYFTLNQEGEVRIYNTFKGLNVCAEVNGEEMSALYGEYITTRTLLYLNKESRSPPVEVTSWRRDLQVGVSITNHLQHLSPSTYLELATGTQVVDKSYGTVEFFIPHGCLEIPTYPIMYGNVEEGEDEIYHDPRRKDELLYTVWKGISSEQIMDDFIEKYYEGYHKPYHPGTEEYDKIISLISSIQQ